MPSSRRIRLSCFTDKRESSFCPSIYISPLVAFSNAFRQRISVLLPEPLGPISATTSLLRTSKSTSLRTCLSPKNLLTLIALMMTSSSTPFVIWDRLPELVTGDKEPLNMVCSESIIYSFVQRQRIALLLHGETWRLDRPK